METKSKRKIFILDTNVLLHEPFALYSFDEHDVVIPMTVLEELDRIKDRNKDVSRDARVAIRALENIFENATPEQISSGVELTPDPDRKGRGRVSIFVDSGLPLQNQSFSESEPDNRIINASLYLKNTHTSRQVTLVTKDINMRLKAKGAGMERVEDYRRDRLVEDIRLLAKGYTVTKGDFWKKIERCDTAVNGRDTIHIIDKEQIEQPFLNEYLLDDETNFAGRISAIDNKNISLLDIGKERLMAKHAWGIHPKDIYQGMALDALLDPNIDMVILTGPAGSGKTLLALSAALEQVIEMGRYDKIIVTRNTPEIAESIGFLPGTEEEKMMPWLAAITDTLEVLHKQDENSTGSLAYIMEKANIQFKSVNFMRGRSIQNAFVLLDECQNLTASQLKTIITRCGEGTKLVCSGNLAQIDSNYLTAVTSGLTYVVEKFKDFEGSANVYLKGAVRSRLASFAEEKM